MINLESINHNLLEELFTSLTIVVVTMIICCIVYPLLVIGVALTTTARTADGSLIYDNQGRVLGSELIAQAFSRSDYFWPRPSAVHFDASASGGSNVSPASPQLRERVQSIIAISYGTAEHLIPADLVTSSGSGLDPHISLKAAQYQAARVAKARNMSLERVLELIEETKETPGNLPILEPIVNVLKLNISLDQNGK